MMQHCVQHQQERQADWLRDRQRLWQVQQVSQQQGRTSAWQLVGLLLSRVAQLASSRLFEVSQSHS